MSLACWNELGAKMEPGFQAWLFYLPSAGERPEALCSEPSALLKAQLRDRKPSFHVSSR